MPSRSHADLSFRPKTLIKLETYISAIKACWHEAFMSLIGLGWTEASQSHSSHQAGLVRCSSVDSRLGLGTHQALPGL